MVRIKLQKLIEFYKSANIAVKASLWFAFCSILQRGISVITMPVFTRLMETAEYGEYTIFQTWYNILILIVTLNVQSEIFNKGLIEHSQEKDHYMSNQAGLLIFLTVFFSIIYLMFRQLVNRLTGLSTFLVLVMMCEILANALITLWSVRRRFEFDYSKIVSLTLLTSVLNPIVGITAVTLAVDKVQARILSNAAVPIVVSIGIIFLVLKKERFFDNFRWWKKTIIISIPLLPHYLSLVLLNQSDKLMINSFVGTEETAIYSVAHSAGLLMTIINTSINNSFVPWVYEKIKGGKNTKIKRVSSMLLGIVVAANICLIWFAPEVISILAGSQYHDAIWCLVPIAASVFFFFVYTLFVDIEIYYGATKYVAIASVCAGGMNLLLNYIFIPIYGYYAAGYTTLFSYFITMIMHYIFLKLTLKMHNYPGDLFDERAIVIWSIVMVVCAALAMSLFDYTAVRFLLACFACVLAIWKRKKICAVFTEMERK